MAHKFLRDDGWFQFPAVNDIVTSTATTTGFLTFVTKSTTVNIAIPNGSYADGPSVAQGSTGIWYVSGNVTLLSTLGNANFLVKLHDGTTTSASGVAATVNTLSEVVVSLSAVASNPAGNLRIAANGSGVAGTLLFNSAGFSNDSTITAIRIG